jgi:hypothetical protein
MEKGNLPADLPLLVLTLHQPVGFAVVNLGWPMPSFRSQGPCLLAVHQGAAYDFREARHISRRTGHLLPAQSKDRIGVVGVARFDGATLHDVLPIPVLYSKGQPGLWRLSPEDEQTVRERYAAALARRTVTSQPGMRWSDQ